MSEKNSLRMGSPAPQIKVERWLLGQRLTEFQPGKVYIVEFWATWCAPCVAAMRHLIELQEKYKATGVEVIGVAASEQGSSAVEAAANLEAWLTERFPNLNYRIAFDHTGDMKKLWMKASYSFAIPTCFVVDGDGHIAFIGAPRQLGEVLPKILKGIWRTSDGAKVADAERIAESEREAREIALREPIEAAIKAEDWATALSAIRVAIAALPDEFYFRVLHADLLLHKMRDTQTGLPVIRRLVQEVIEQKSAVLMANVLGILFDPAKDHDDFPSAERFAIGKDLSGRILALNPPEDDENDKLCYKPVAQYYYESGERDRAIKLVELTIPPLEKWLENFDDELKQAVTQAVLPPLLQTLANYKGEKVCHGDLCAIPQKHPEIQEHEEEA